MSRIMVIAHAHPQFSVGGGEIAAHRHAGELRRRGHEVMFIGRTGDEPMRPGTPFSTLPGRPGDVLFHSPSLDYFLLSQPRKAHVHSGFRSLLERFRPDVVHFHHYLHLGIELIREVRKYAADVPIVLTLHEYAAICHRDGQMVKADGRLCIAASPRECHHCFPSRTPQDFFLRELFIKSYFGLVDRFVAPSRFLRQRYIDWGIAPEGIVVIENGQPDPGPTGMAAPDDAERLCRNFGFFGQISELKGIFVLLNAVRALPKKVHRRVHIDINGSLQYQPDAAKARILGAIADAGDGVHFAGPYRADELAALMRRVGWVVVPSTWWENSPLVIQEAFRRGRPVICSDIGGMAEKVRDRETGLHFRVGNPADLAARIEEACDPSLWRKLAGAVAAPPDLGATTERHLELYQEIRAARSSRPVPRLAVPRGGPCPGPAAPQPPRGDPA